jgi:hypothetical protein
VPLVSSAACLRSLLSLTPLSLSCLCRGSQRFVFEVGMKQCRTYVEKKQMRKAEEVRALSRS